MSKYAEIQKNLVLFEEEKAQRMSNPFYRLRLNIYKFKKRIVKWIQ
jgi:hypothetical protein